MYITKERYKLHLRQEIIMKLFHKIIAKFSVLSFCSALSRPLTRRIAHQNDNTGDVKPGKEGHLIGGLLWIASITLRPPRQRLANIYPVLPLWVLINACRCGFIQVAKNSKSSEIVNDSPPRLLFSVKLICSG